MKITTCTRRKVAQSKICKKSLGNTVETSNSGTAKTGKLQITADWKSVIWYAVINTALQKPVNCKFRPKNACKTNTGFCSFHCIWKLEYIQHKPTSLNWSDNLDSKVAGSEFTSRGCYFSRWKFYASSREGGTFNFSPPRAYTPGRKSCDKVEIVHFNPGFQ